MGEVAMELGNKELEKIGEYVQSHLGEWTSGKNVIQIKADREMELLERIVRVEEGLRNQAELMRQGFEIMEKRFEQMQYSIDKRFEQVDKRFNDMNSRFTQLQWTMGIGFTILAALMGVFNFF